MPDFFGICGRFNPRPCTLAWSSTYPNKVGVYPSDLLPSTRTTWYAASDGGYDFNPPVISPGESFGLPILGGFTVTGTFSTQFDTFNPQTHIIVDFARTANRLNVAHVLTQEEIESTSEDPDGFATIDVGEYIFEFVAATDSPEQINTELTPEEIEAIQGQESESDRQFRKLFEQNIPLNRFQNVVINRRGIEYRLDNGGPKATTAFEQAGQGDLQNTTGYRDASSKKIRISITRFGDNGQPLPNNDDVIRLSPGDVIYLTYVAVKEHYIRQSVNYRWSLSAISLPPQCFGIPVDVKVAHYRFYEWEIGADGNDPPERLAGWRIVETFGVPVNFNCLAGEIGATPDLADFVLGGGSGSSTLNYLPTNPTIVTPSELDAFIANRASYPTYQVELNNQLGDANYSRNVGVNRNNQVFRLSDWFNRGQVPVYDSFNDAKRHVFFNVHPIALQKRDVDKFGIERFLAQEVEQDIKEGKLTSFPFMDDPNVNAPASGPNNLVTLDNSNTKFEPVEPVTRWTTSNGEVECGVAGAIQLGNFSGGRGDVLAVFGISSNIITERFEKDTRLLVERHFTFGQLGPRTVAIQGAAGPQNAVSCIAGKQYKDAFVSHVDGDGLLLYNKFNNSYVNAGINKLEYRPDLAGAPLLDNQDPTPDQFEAELGASGNLGAIPGFRPGKIISVSKYLDISKFKYKTINSTSFLFNNPEITPQQVEQINIQVEAGKITIPLSTGFHGRTEIEYTLRNSIGPVVLRFKAGSNLETVVDSVTFPRSLTTNKKIISHQWTKGDSLEIAGEGVENIVIQKLIVTQLQDDVGNDFLNEQSSSDKPNFDDLEFLQRSSLFETGVMSISQDNKGGIFIFYNDSDDGISCVSSHDGGESWYYFYGIVEAIAGEPAQNPFCVESPEQNACFLFYSFQEKILCKRIPFDYFKFEDAFIIERFSVDVLDTNVDPPTESASRFSSTGSALRRNVLAYAAAGDLIDTVFLETVGKNLDTNRYEFFEFRNVPNFNTPQFVRKQPLAIGFSTAFTNQNIEDINFSAYRTSTGQMKLFFLHSTQGGGNTLQCNFSNDNGVSWYDLWEFIEHGYGRLRIDPDDCSAFIDRQGTSEPGQDITATNPKESPQDAYFGVNVHWSRLKRHKKEGGNTLDAESEVLEINSPYLFYHPETEKVFLFYIYQGCLLCKVFSDSLFDTSAETKRTSDPNNTDAVVGITAVKKVIEQELRASFIDGDLTSDELKEEIHFYINEDSNERMVEGNIVFNYQAAFDQFNSDRTISNQRVCAYDLPNGNVRVFYKHNSSNDLKSAIWNGSVWMVEDFMKNPATSQERVMPTFSDQITDVIGGFNGEGFTG